MLRRLSFFLVLAVTAGADILPGSTRQEVLAALGRPKSTVASGNLEIMYYPDFAVSVEGDRVVNSKPSTVDTGRSKFVLTASNPNGSKPLPLPTAAPVLESPVNNPVVVSPGEAPVSFGTASTLIKAHVLPQLLWPWEIEWSLPSFPSFWPENISARLLEMLAGPLHRLALVGLFFLLGYAFLEFLVARHTTHTRYSLAMWGEISRSRPKQLLPLIPPRNRQPPSLKAEWSLDALRRIDSPDFRKLVAAYHRIQGYQAEMTRSIPAGVDIAVHRPGETTPCLLIKCQAPAEKRIDQQQVAEFHRLMISGQAETGAFYTTGEFTEEAKVLNQEKNHELIGGIDFLTLISYLPPSQQTRLWEEATQTHSFPPV